MECKKTFKCEICQYEASSKIVLKVTQPEIIKKMLREEIHNISLEISPPPNHREQHISRRELW